jgi:hypothetical protein
MTNDTFLQSGEKTPNGDWISKKDMVGHIDLLGRNCCHEFHSGPIFSGQVDSSLSAQNHSVILPQPIYDKNYIYALESMMMRFDKKSTPLMAILIARHIYLVFISPPSELTIMVYFMIVVGRLCFGTNFDGMKECDAPESNKIVAGCEFARNIPNTTSWDCWASSVVTWLTLS